MSDTRWQPQWWTQERHGSAWERAKSAMKRDWEQTKSDLHLGGRDLDQSVDDTVKQAVGSQPLPSPGESTPHDPAIEQGGAWSASIPWDDAEPALSYGYCAREELGAQHPAWNEQLEQRLRGEWDGGHADHPRARRWDDVRAMVRRGYERARA